MIDPSVDLSKVQSQIGDPITDTHNRLKGDSPILGFFSNSSRIAEHPPLPHTVDQGRGSQREVGPT